MQIDLKVKHQRILGVQQIPRLVIEKTTGFVYLNLEFDDEWDGCNIIVLLTNDRQSGNPVQYTWNGEPIEVSPELLVTGTLRVSCVGLETDDQGEKVQRLTTKRMSEGVRIHRAGDQTGVEPGTTVPGLWEQAMATMGPLQMLETENKGNMVDAINEIKKVAEIKPNVEIGEVKTGEAGTEAQVTNTGAYPNMKFNFVLPEGEPGVDGTTPHVGKNGNWWLGAQDTGVVAKAPSVDVEMGWAAAGNVLVPEYILTITQPDGTKREVRWNDGAPGEPGRDSGTYYPMLSEDGVLTFQYVGYMQPVPEEWKPTKIVGDKGDPGYTPVKGVDYTDGVSPTASIATIPGGTRLTINDIEGVKTVDILNGRQGDKGEPGKGLDILGTYASLSALEAAVTSPEQGDMYNVGASAPYNLYMYDAVSGWLNQGQLQGAKGTTFIPSMDADGNLSWSNDGGLVNPETVRIVGKTPEKGVDYFTEADKQEIAQQAAGLVEVPEPFSGKYEDLTGRPTIPAALSQLTEDATHRTVTDAEKAAWDAKSDFSGDYNDLINLPGAPSEYVHPTYIARNSGLYKITVDSTGHVYSVSPVAKSDITGLGVPAQDTTYGAATTTAPGLMSASDKNKLDGVAPGANAYSHPSSHPASMITGLADVAKSGSFNDLLDQPTIPDAYTHPSTHAASMISAGTFAGQVVANASGQDAGSYVVRNSKLSSAEETPTVNGQICWKYK